LTNDFSGKELPFSLEAEQTVLGGILLEPSTLPVVMEYLKPESFYKEQHRELFAIFMRMFSNGQTADLITVLNESVALGIFETSAMAKTYLKGLMESIPSVANIESYCKIVEEKFYLRALINAANEIIRNATEGTVDATNLLDSAEQKIFDIRQGKASNGLARIDSVLIDTMSRLGQLSGENKEKYAGAKTGFSQLDNVTTGLNNSDLLVIGARPGMGKTAFAINIATNACKRNHKSVAIFNLEMGKELFNQAYDKAIAEGLMTETDVIEICVGIPNAESKFYNNGYDFLVNNYTEAVKGTKLEGKLTFTRDDTIGNGFSDALKSNQVNLLFGVGWTGSALDPYGLMEAYTSTSYQYDPAWDTTTTPLTISLDGVNYTATVWEWTEIMAGEVRTITAEDGTTKEYSCGVADKDPETRLVILAALEGAVLQTYDMLPIMDDASVALKGMQINYYTEDYIYGVGRGGVKYMTYNYTDAEWDAFVAAQGGTLNYK